jgi:hypothetical protein
VLTQSFDDTDGRLIGTSLGFSIFSALGAAGARARQRSGIVAAVGSCTMLAAGASFALLVAAIWNHGPSELTRCFGAVAVATLAASHASLILSSRRPGDTALINGLCAISIAAGSIDAVLGVVAITGAVVRVDAVYARTLAVLVIVLLLSTALAPILRRLPRTGRPSDAQSLAGPVYTSRIQPTVSVEFLAIARRLDALAPQAGELAWQLQTDAAALRRIASEIPAIG